MTMTHASIHSHMHTLAESPADSLAGPSVQPSLS